MFKKRKTQLKPIFIMIIKGREDGASEKGEKRKLTIAETLG